MIVYVDASICGMWVHRWQDASLGMLLRQVRVVGSHDGMRHVPCNSSWRPATITVVTTLLLLPQLLLLASSLSMPFQRAPLLFGTHHVLLYVLSSRAGTCALAAIRAREFVLAAVASLTSGSGRGQVAGETKGAGLRGAVSGGGEQGGAAPDSWRKKLKGNAKKTG